MKRKVIKNPHIIHFGKQTEYGIRYTCNQAVDPTPAKTTWQPMKVTCKNCLRAMGG